MTPKFKPYGTVERSAIIPTNNFRMKITILADSNLAQHVFKDEANAGKILQAQVKIIRASTITSFTDFLADLEDTNVLLISTLLNQVAQLDSSWSGNIDEEKTRIIVDLISNMTEAINQYAADYQQCKVLVVPPFVRTHPQWLFDSLEDIEKV